jgi:hypothetical protein
MQKTTQLSKNGENSFNSLKTKLRKKPVFFLNAARERKEPIWPFFYEKRFRKFFVSVEIDAERSRRLCRILKYMGELKQVMNPMKANGDPTLTKNQLQY